MMDNPLNLPELIYYVGRFITLWEPVKNRPGQYNFRPRDLIACIKVNKTWQRTLVPFLWTVHHDSWMEDWDIPQELIATHGRYFRYLSLSWDRPLVTFQSTTRIRELELSNTNLSLTTLLVRSNPQLARLDLTLPDGVSDPDLQAALESLTRLQRLRLSYVEHPDAGLISRILKNNPDLTELSLDHLNSPTAPTIDQPLVCLTNLHLDCDWYQSPGLVHLLPVCPNLEVLTFSVNSHCPAAEIAYMLKKHCPKLKTLKGIQDFDIFDPEMMMTDNQFVTLIQSTCRLVHFDMSINNLTISICQALLGLHAAWLETVHLVLGGYSNDTFDNINKILSSCPNLTSFAVSSEVEECPAMAALGMFAEPWNCAKLNTFKVSGMYFSDEEAAVDTPNNNRHEVDPADQIAEDDSVIWGYVSEKELHRRQFREALAANRWALDCAPRYRTFRSHSFQAHVLAHTIFSHCSALPGMHTVHLNEFEYVRTT
ncbi:hypothetical protein BGZ81_001415 [Podila clonocystis]|nr:hypothetical protein BGZ81_001415 [Podila clonocystis]